MSKYTTTSAEVLSFIDRFVRRGPEYTMHSIFSNGLCYWFAEILKKRFDTKECHAFLMYSPVLNHFATYIETELSNDDIRSSVFDINGLVPIHLEDQWTSWARYKLDDPLVDLQVIHNTILQDDDWEQPEEEINATAAWEQVWEYNHQLE